MGPSFLWVCGPKCGWCGVGVRLVWVALRLLWMGGANCGWSELLDIAKFLKTETLNVSWAAYVLS